MGKGELPDELKRFAAALMDPQSMDGISIEGMVARFNAFERRLPQIHDIPDELKAKQLALVEAHRQKVKDLGLK